MVENLLHGANACSGQSRDPKLAARGVLESLDGHLADEPACLRLSDCVSRGGHGGTEVAFTLERSINGKDRTLGCVQLLADQKLSPADEGALEADGLVEN